MCYALLCQVKLWDKLNKELLLALVLQGLDAYSVLAVLGQAVGGAEGLRLSAEPDLVSNEAMSARVPLPSRRLKERAC